MLLGYNTNGLAHHDPLEAIDLLAELGYRSVAITLDHNLLSPRLGEEELARQVEQVRERLAEHNMRSVVETGARFLLDPRRKHQPTLLSSANARRPRIEFLRHAIRVAAALGSDCVSLWSGTATEPLSAEEAETRLAIGLAEVLTEAEAHEVTLGFEPEPGMFIDTMAKWDSLRERVNHERLQLTLDLGHLHCMGETPLEEYVLRYGPQLGHIHIEDMRAGVHEHLMFGEGEIDFAPVFAALGAVNYTGGVHVELSRHSHEAPQAARRAAEFLAPWFA